MNNLNSTNTTVISDNSSESASNSKITPSKTESEIVDLKINKCVNEINNLKQKIQREWSKQMNSHLKGFYSGDKSNGNEKMSTPKSSYDTNELEKRIAFLNKKLHSYEKRKIKLMEENRKEKENSSKQQESDKEKDQQASNEMKKVQSTHELNNSTPLNPIATNNAINQLNVSSTSNSSSLPLRTNTRTLSATFDANTKLAFGNDETQTQVNKTSEENGKLTSGTSFYLSNQEVKSMNDTDDNLVNISVTDEINMSVGQNGSSLINNKSYQTLDKNLFLQFEQQLYYLKLQNEKLQSDMEDIQKKLQDNQQMVIKEIQHSCNQIPEPVHTLFFNLFKSYNQKVEDLKTSFERSTQTLTYNLTHLNREIKETREDVTYMKNRIEIFEKTQKNQNVEGNPTNYYQLFYKLLDILLTLATIILLAFTNMIASVKFIFLLYPRTILMILFLYFVFFYVIDYEKLDINVNSLFFLNELDSKSSKSNFFLRVIQSVYNSIFKTKLIQT